MTIVLRVPNKNAMDVLSGLAATAWLPRQDAGAGPRAARHRRRATAPPLPQAGRPARPPRSTHEAVQVGEMIPTKVPDILSHATTFLFHRNSPT